ncbi:hypothetical protein ScPMuIL_008350 [Solemya velum]
MMTTKWSLPVMLIWVIPAVTVSCCRHPPSVWCSSPEIAKECQVTKQCSSFYSGEVNANPVNFTVYLEYLCPDCKQFMAGELYKAYTKLSSIMNLGLVPYGNARESKVGSKWKFKCQHGEKECLGNIIETCSMYVLPNISVYFPFIHCMEASYESPKESSKKCAKSLQIDLAPILECAESIVGNQLEHQMALKTAALKPAHTYVPWVTLNGVHTEDIQKQAESDLVKLICDTYKGPKPSACTESEKARKCWKL